MELVERNGCPLCGHQAHTVHIAFPDIPVVGCSKCGFLYSGRTLDPSALQSYYTHGFGSERHRRGQRVNARVNVALLKQLVDLGTVRSVLDVGTGYGFLLSELRKSGVGRRVGVELSEMEFRHARDTLGEDVRNAPLHEAGLADERFDLVTSFEVIEHVLEPLALLREMASFVRPGGKLIVGTDNFTSRVARELGPAFPKWIPHSHVSHFSPDTMRTALDGLDGVSVEHAVSFTPWELRARSAYWRARRKRADANQCFDLVSTLKTEMRGVYRGYAARLALNPRWAAATVSRETDGAIMCFVCTKRTAT